MELTFHDQIEFESFARVYMAGVAVRDKTGPTTIGGPISVTHVVGAVTQTVAAPTVAEVVEMQAAMDNVGVDDLPVDWQLDHVSLQEVGDSADTVVHEHIDLPPADEPEQQAEKPKRKRRSKAEIEAAEAAERAALLAEGNIKPAEPEADELPAVMEVVGGVADGGPVQLGPKDAPKHQASAESIEKHAAAQAEYTPELIETLKGQAELFDANRTAHLNEGREAIAKHGFIKYMATFKGLGLDSAIATYNDDQVKLHRAAIAHLMAA